MRRPEAGFTLIEVLVASTVLSLVLMLTVSAMRMIGSSSARVVDVVASNDEMRTVSLFLHDLVRGAATYSAAQGGGGGGTWGAVYSQFSQSGYFEGDSRSVAWLSALPVVPGQAGKQYLRVTQDKDRLILQSVAYEEGVDTPDWSRAGDAETLLEEVSEFRVSYRWVPEDPWGVEESEDERLPAAVKLRLRVRDKYWPDLVIALDNYSAPPLARR